MVHEGKGRLFRRKDRKFLVYLPLDLAEDSMFPFKPLQLGESVAVKVSFIPGGAKRLIIEEWKGQAI